MYPSRPCQAPTLALFHQHDKITSYLHNTYTLLWDRIKCSCIHLACVKVNTIYEKKPKGKLFADGKQCEILMEYKEHRVWVGFFSLIAQIRKHSAKR